LLIPRSLRTTSASFAGMSTHSRHPSTIGTAIYHECSDIHLTRRAMPTFDDGISRH
jgi:hypothetical protein